MNTPTHFNPELAELVQRLHSTQELDATDTVEQVVEFACKTLEVAGASITLSLKPGRYETVAPTDDRVLQADALQYEYDEGPCVEAATTSRTLFSRDLRDDARWPRWGPAVAAMGYRSVLSAELHARGRKLGSLNLYGDRPRQFDWEDAETAHLFAMHAAAAMGAARTEAGLRDALTHRDVIGEAKGILMERFGLDSPQAFAVLRRISQAANRKLHEVARELVETRTLPGGDDLPG